MAKQEFSRQYNLHKHIAANLTTLGYRCLWTDTYVIAMNSEGEQIAGADYLGDNKYKLWATESKPVESIIIDLLNAGVPGWYM